MTFDLVMRGAAIGINLLLAFALVRQFRAIPAAWLGALFTVGVAAYAMGSIPGWVDKRAPGDIVLITLAAGNNVVFWVFARALFDDEFRPGWQHFLVWLLCVALAFVAIGVVPTGSDLATTAAGWAGRLLAIILLAWAVIVAIRGRPDDLIESRRLARLTLVIVVALYAIVVLIHEIAIGSAAGPLVSAANAFGLAALSGAFAAMLLRLDDGGMFARTGRAPAPTAPTQPLSPAPADVDLVRRLEALMARDKPYREPGLSIGKLAARLDLPEYRLRRAINGVMGFRNFNGFVNSYRLAECQAALADPSQDEVSVLTIALDAGFQSLATFNRAFRAATGSTPSEFRSRRPRA